MPKINHHVASDNIFADLGVPQPAEALAKADLARQLISIIKERGLTQTAAADILGIDQPKISALMRGRLGGFSMERLMHFLVALGKQIEVVVHEPVQAVPKIRVFSGRPTSGWSDPSNLLPLSDMIFVCTSAFSMDTVGSPPTEFAPESGLLDSMANWLDIASYRTQVVPSQESARVFAHC